MFTTEFMHLRIIVYLESLMNICTLLKTLEIPAFAGNKSFNLPLPPMLTHG